MKKKVLIGIIVGLIVICLVVGVILLITLNNKTDDTNLPIDNSYFDELKPSEGLEMTLIDDERSYAVSGIGTCTDTEIVIPKTYMGKEVSRIESDAFYGNDSIVSVIIPDSIKIIGGSAFSECTSLAKITLSDSITNIYCGAFDDCPLLKEVYYIGELEDWFNIDLSDPWHSTNPLNNGADLYINGEKLVDLIVPDSVTSIYLYAFEGCTSLKSVVIGDSVTHIGGNAFENCINIDSVSISDSVMGAGCDIFLNCPLVQYTEYSGAKYLGNSSNPYVILIEAQENISSCNIAEGTKVISQYAFRSNTNLTNVSIPNSIVGISSYAFEGCYSLKYNQYDNGLYLGNSENPYVVLVKAKNKNITSCDIHSDTKIIRNAFEDCSKLKGITIPNSVKYIDDFAFENCTLLREITIPDSVERIGGGAFYNCKNLSKITFSSFLKEIESSAFHSCVSLKNVYYNGNLDEWLKIKFDSSTSNPLNNGAALYFNGELVTSVNIPDGCKSLNDYAFVGCNSIESVKLPNSLETVSDYAFSKCVALTDINIPNSVNEIGNSAFKDCISLENIDIPNSVTKIGSNAFQACYSFESIVIPDSVTYMGGGTFYECTSLKNVSLGSGITSISASRGYDQYDDYTILGMFEYCKSLESLTIPQTVTYVGDDAFASCYSIKDVYYTGNVEDWCNINFVSSPMRQATNLYFDGELVTNVVIPDTVTNIGNGVFCNYDLLISVTIGNSVTSIGERAFSGCDSLTSVTIGNSVTSIGHSAFSGCTSLTSVTIGNSVTSIGDDSFYKCTSLKNVYYTGDIEDWLGITFSDSKSNPCSNGANLYFNNNLVTEIEIPDSVTNIGDYAFYGCISLTSVTIGNSVTSIGSYAFRDCTSLTSITIPDSVTSIGESAFEGCTSLTSITIPNSVTSIGGSAFEYCYSLIEVCNKSSLKITAGSSNNGDVGRYAKHIITDESQSAIKYIDDYVFFDDGTDVYFVKYLGNETEITLPKYDGGKEYGIWKYAFYKNDKITSITIPDSVTSIGDYAFSGCDSLTSVTIPDSVKSIGGGAFKNCTSLKYNEYNNAYYLGNENNPYVILIKAENKNIMGCEIYNSTKFICSSAFYECTSLTSITIPSSVTSIATYAFAYCTSLTSINFEGTTAQWHAISKGTSWKYNVPATEVICSDGTVSLK